MSRLGTCRATVVLGPDDYRWTLLAVVAVGAILRLIFLFQPMRYDEAFSFLFFASRPLSEGLSDYAAPNNHE